MLAEDCVRIGLDLATLQDQDQEALRSRQDQTKGCSVHVHVQGWLATFGTYGRRFCCMLYLLA